MSEIKVNKLTPRTNCGTVTLGDSGDTFTIPSGVTISNSGTAAGFAGTGEISWDTTVKTTGTFTATSGVGYFLNTTGGVITVNLPAGAAGSSVAMVDYAGTWQTNKVTVSPNGSEKMGGVAADVNLNVEGQSVTFVYIDGTRGWVNVSDSTSNITGASFIVATGGTPSAGETTGDYKYHTFTGPGTFCVASLSNCASNNDVDYLVIAGGGAGGSGNFGEGGGGGGAGGYRESPGSATGCYTVSPRGAAPATALTVTVQGYSIAVGGGGTIAAGTGNDGNVSTFSTITATGGGGGGGQVTSPTARPGSPGGSGGGSSGSGSGAGSGNTPPFNPAQGTNAGAIASPITCYGGSSGGGATVAGVANSPPSQIGAGGVGGTSSINGTPTARAGGGTGGRGSPMATGAATGGGGAGGIDSGSGTAGTINTGGGGGGGGKNSPATNAGGGGSGIVIIRYKYQ